MAAIPTVFALRNSERTHKAVNWESMNSSDDEDFGGVDDEDLMLVATQAEERATKRRRLNGLETRDSKDDGERRNGHLPRTLQVKHRASSPSSDDEDDGFDPLSAPPQHKAGSRNHADNEAATPINKPKSKYRIHIPQVSELPQDTYHTQLPRSSASPYRLGGPKWQKQKRPSTPPNVHTTGVGKSVAIPSRGIGERQKATSDEDEALAFTPVRTGSGGSARRRRHPQAESSPDEDEALGFTPVRTSSGGGTKPVRREKVHTATKLPFNAPAELADIPSDIFSSPTASDQGNAAQQTIIASQLQQSLSRRSQQPQNQRLVGPQANLRQTTLFGENAPDAEQQSQSARRRNWPLANKNEPPTHHELDRDALKTWVYPTNLGTIRDYQYNIVSRGLYHNLLVALPTGLGKTFIAATIMLNWFRWTADAQIVFVAPTKPLVSQQVEACFNIAGIPRSATTMLTGGTAPGIRAEEWQSKRVFFMTPQTIINDLKSGICDPKKIVLLVVDEAHRATGNYAYVEVVRFLRRFNTSFRVLALTATPGASVEAVQDVIDGLGISRVEIRTEESLDIRQYVHSRKIETALFDNSAEMSMVMDLFSKALQPLLSKLNGMNAYWSKDPMALTPYGCTKARQQWMMSDGGKKASFGIKGMVNTIFSILAGLSHATELLKYHGIGPFFHKVLEFRSSVSSGEKGSKYRKEINESEPFQKMMTRLQGWINNPEFVGHPKLEYLRSVVLNHFLDAGEGRGNTNGAPPSSTRIMIFAHYRDSAEEVARVLKRNEPMIRPHVFVGQANSKGSDGMDQKKQLEIIQQFKNGIYNTLVATSIGEEGLDIGEVDLIVCYDASASPIRMLQRMGRTGRKRAGNIVVTLMKGKEEKAFEQAKDNYEKMQQMIAAGTRFKFHDDTSPRIVPKEIQPVVDKKIIEIPLENTQPQLPESKRKGKAPKRPPKKFQMPDGVRTGFVKASRMDGDDSDEASEDAAALTSTAIQQVPPIELEGVPPLSEVLLTASDEKELERSYQDVGGDTPQIVDLPRLDIFPALQRTLRRTKHCRHGQATKRLVNLLNAMHNMDEVAVADFAKYLRPEDEAIGLAQAQKRAVWITGSPEGAISTPSEILIRSSQRSVVPRHAARPKRKAALTIALTSSGEDELGRDDLGDLVIENIGEGLGAASSVPSPPPSESPSKPFYRSQQAADAAEPESADELPEFSTLVQKGALTTASALVEHSHINVPPEPTQRGKRRLVVEDDSDEE